mmetsp:Transcript_146559/g.365467  ORF Transcript_146559/g.365467 Transcript_146559/m.365467 type:complete len:575 (-) Transcript_146559:157-1881(-)
MSASHSIRSLTLETVEQAVTALEERLREVESMSAVLDFDSGQVRDTLRITNTGVAKLASEVSDELHTWREQQEEEHEKQHRELLERLRQAVDNRREEMIDRQSVQGEIRRGLVEHASKALTRGSNMCYSKMDFHSDNGNHQQSTKSVHTTPESVGAKALAQLKSRLDVVVSPVEALRPEQPPEMLRALATTAHALERKSRRAPDLQKKLLDATGHMDANILREADLTSAARKVQLMDQGRRQAGLLDSLRQAQQERQELFEQLDEAMREGPPLVQAPIWATLYPMRNVERRTAIRARSNTVDEAKHKILQRGEDHILDLLERFRESHLKMQLSDLALDADADLEAWKLTAQQELLDAMKTSADANHRALLQEVKRAIVTCNDNALEQLNSAVADAEVYQKTRTEVISVSCNLAQDTLAGVCDKGVSVMQSRRRRIEHCALKRWADIKDHVDGAAAASNASTLLQVGEVTQRCVEDCHQSLKMPSAIQELQGLEQSGVADTLVSAWERLGASIENRLDFVMEIVDQLPETPETCAVAHGVLCLIDEACKSQIERLKVRVEQFQGSLIFSHGSNAD